LPEHHSSKELEERNLYQN